MFTYMTYIYICIYIYIICTYTCICIYKYTCFLVCVYVCVCVCVCVCAYIYTSQSLTNKVDSLAENFLKSMGRVSEDDDDEDVYGLQKFLGPQVICVGGCGCGWVCMWVVIFVGGSGCVCM